MAIELELTLLTDNDITKISADGDGNTCSDGRHLRTFPCASTNRMGTRPPARDNDR